MLPLQVLKDENAPAMALLAIVLHKFGVESLSMLPELLREKIEQEFGYQISDLQSDKLQAAITVLSSNLHKEQWEVFKTVVLLFNSIADEFDTFEFIEAEHLAAGLAEIALIEDSLTETEPYSDEVKAFVGNIMANYGFCKPPKIFPDAIMPPSNGVCDVHEKDEALQEIFNTKTKYTTDYLSKLELL